MELVDSTHAAARYLWLLPVCSLLPSLSCDPQKHAPLQRARSRVSVAPVWASPHLRRLSSFAALLLLDVEHPVAAGAGVVRVLEVVHEEGDQAAAQHQPAAKHVTFETRPLGHVTWKRPIKAHDQSGLSRAPTRSRWRASTWATRTSRLCRWRWSWPAAGSWCTSSCRGSSPAPCRSWRTSVSHPWAQGLDWRSLLFVLQRSKVRGGASREHFKDAAKKKVYFAFLRVGLPWCSSMLSRGLNGVWRW